MRLILMGNGPFAVPAFDEIQTACRSSDESVIAVVTRPQRAVKSRGGPPPAPVRDWAQAHRLPHFAPANVNDAETIGWLTSLAADVLVVCDFGQILSPEALATTSRGGINLHGSLLPAYRGAAPVQRAMLGGETLTGVSLIHMTPRLDGGPILTTASTEILAHETAGELEQRLSQLGVGPTLEALEMLRRWDGHSPLGDPQDAAAVSKAPRLNKAEARIDFDRPGRLLDAHVRGMQPWPVAFLEVDAGGKTPVRVQVLGVKFLEGEMDGRAAGELRVDPSGVQVRCRDGAILLTRVKPAGKREMAGADWARGLGRVGQVLT